jgi:hypothetical protein
MRIVLARTGDGVVEFRRIDLRPELRPQTGTDRDDRRVPRGHGPTPMLYRGEVIGQSDQPIYEAARWLLGQGIASPGDEIATYRGEVLSMSGSVGELARWAVEERKKGRAGMRLIPWRPFSRDDIGPPAADMPNPAPERLPGQRRPLLGKGTSQCRTTTNLTKSSIPGAAARALLLHAAVRRAARRSRAASKCRKPARSRAGAGRRASPRPNANNGVRSATGALQPDPPANNRSNPQRRGGARRC